MRIEAVIVCHNYSDFLEHTLPENLQFLDGAVVVTTPGDRATRALCERLSVDCIDTEVFFDSGDRFNKGRGINLGLSHLRHDDWLLHLDADTLLPHRFRGMLDAAKLDKSCVYGADRRNIIGFDKFEEFKARGHNPQWTYRYLVSAPEGLSMGARLIHKEYGFCPIGYFQLWHSSQRRRYPINQGSAEHTDVLFSVQWPREKRILLPELYVYHLESERAKMGANWAGRTTKKFGAREQSTPEAE